MCVNIGALTAWQCAEGHSMSLLYCHRRTTGNRPGSHLRLPVDSLTLTLTVNERTALLVSLCYSIVAIISNISSSAAATTDFSAFSAVKHTVAPLGKATERLANSNAGTLHCHATGLDKMQADSNGMVYQRLSNPGRGFCLCLVE